jgi:hypothetical protein
MGELIGGTWHRSGVDALLSQGALRRPRPYSATGLLPTETVRRARAFSEPNATATIYTYRLHVLGLTARLSCETSKGWQG